MSYAEIAAGALRERADVVVCHFSLLGKVWVDGLLATMPGLLEPGGVLLVQTLHPLMAAPTEACRDGWREGCWVGCGDGFSQPAPWYFRTLGSWLDAFQAAGLRLIRLVEPVHPHTGRPASAIFMVGVGQGGRGVNRHRAVAFRAAVQSGNKQWVVALPFDPVSQWSTPARPLWRCGHGHRVRGSLNGQDFRGAVVERAGAFWLLLEESLTSVVGLDVGQWVDVLIEPEDA